MTKDIPFWVSELLTQVCKDEGRSKFPKITWRVSRVNKETGGRYNPWKKRIIVTAGIIGDDHKQVFLHEVCHWLTQPRGIGKPRFYFFGDKRKKRSWHNKRFYQKLKVLLERYDCLTQEYRERENGYMKRSVSYL